MNTHTKRIRMRKLFIAAVAMLAILPACSQKKQDDRNFEIVKNLDVFNYIYRELDLFYVDSIEAKDMIRTGLNAIFNRLDPYTVYYSEDEIEELKIMTTGKYGGIGSIIRMREDSTVIIHEPYEGMPAAEVGLQVGDILMKIDDTDLKGKTTSEVSDLLRGEPGTTFALKIQRPGEKKARQFKVTRRNIKTPTIPYSGLYGTTGYISFTQFTENSAQDVRRAFISLKEKGAQSLVLDLRGNGGGSLAEAVDIVNLFIPKGKTVVDVKGKARSSNASYKTRTEPLDTVMPITILVNGITASSAEIVSGALQDFDRAVIIGSKTVGKGLVQSVRQLPYNGNLKLTTAKYYIPSGRCIQEIDYKSLRNKTTDGKTPDSLKHTFFTAGGRKVLDAGGITPDVEVDRDTLPNILFYLSNDDVLIDYGTRYFQSHATIPPVSQFEITDRDFEDFKKMVMESDFEYDRLSDKRLQELKKVAEFEGYLKEAEAEFKALEKKLEHNLERDLDNFKKDIKMLMAQEIIKRYYYQAGIIEQQLKDDPDFKRALEILGNKEEYNKILGKK